MCRKNWGVVGKGESSAVCSFHFRALLRSQSMEATSRSVWDVWLMSKDCSVVSSKAPQRAARDHVSVAPMTRAGKGTHSPLPSLNSVATGPGASPFWSGLMKLLGRSSESCFQMHEIKILRMTKEAKSIEIQG